MDEKKLTVVENVIDLETTVSEQISDMQLIRIREKAMARDLSFDEIKSLEILSKIKNTEVEKRTPKEDKDPKAVKQARMKELANTITGSLVKIAEVKENVTEKDPPAKH